MREQEVGYEAGTPPFTAKETARLNAFSMIEQRIHEAEHDLQECGRPLSVGNLNEKGQVVDEFFKMDRRFISIWKEKALSMYESDFAGKEHLRDAAQDIVETVGMQTEPATLSPQALSSLWERD
jgi:hypothetical protein